MVGGLGDSDGKYTFIILMLIGKAFYFLLSICAYLVGSMIRFGKVSVGLGYIGFCSQIQLSPISLFDSMYQNTKKATNYKIFAKLRLRLVNSSYDPEKSLNF